MSIQLKTIVAMLTLALALVITLSDANALTLKSGEVLTHNGVVKASESENTKRAIENNGFHISGGELHIGIMGEVVSVSINDLKGKSKDEIKELIGEAASAQLEFYVADTTAHEAELAAEGFNVVSSIEEAMESGGIDTAVNEANEAVAAAVKQAAQDFVNDPNGVNAEAIADGHEVYVGDPSGAPGA